jgi:hypothetical protein
MASTLKITFDAAPTNLENIEVKINTGIGITSAFLTFVNLRQGIAQVTNTDRLNADKNFATAWNLDYKNFGSTNNLVASYSLYTVTITLLNDAWQFDSVSGTLITNAKVSTIINNDAIVTPKSAQIDSFTTDAANPCLNAIANISAIGGTGVYNIRRDGNTVSSGLSSPMQLNLPRGSFSLISITDSAGENIKTFNLVSPRKFIANDFDLKVENFTGGATLNIDLKYISSYLIPAAFSLDNITFQDSNVFAGLPDGNYTVYVKDAFGCVVSRPIFIDGYTDLTETVFTISNINSVQYTKAENGKKNIQNTLSCNELKRVTYPFYHKFLADDVITNQLKTNANYLNIYTIDGQGVTNSLQAVQKSTNTNLKAKSTATYFDLGGGRSAIYFGLVDILDYTTESVIDQSDFGFTLPEWANQEGKYVTISGLGQVKIDAISYSEVYDAFVLEFNIAMNSFDGERIVSAIYNLQPYELFEFSVPMASSPELFNIVIEAGLDADNIQFTYVSEKLKQVSDHENLFKISYSDAENKGDMVYQTGIQHLIRLEGQTDYLGEQNTEGYDGDTEFYSTQNSVYTSERFYFPRLSTNIAHKMRLVMSHKNLNINGIDYKIAETPEINTNINNNSKSFSVLLKSGGNEFLSKNQEIISGSTESELGVGAIEASKGKSLILWTKQNG